MDSDRIATSSVAPDDAGSSAEAAPASPGTVASPRWLVIAAWSLGPTGLYALASLAHAALVERALTVEVGFGRCLAFWIGAIYLALPLWGFLPARPTGRYARRPLLLVLAAIGLVGAVVSAAFTALWLGGHWVASVGGPVVGSIVLVLVAGMFTLWLAGREDRRADAA